MSFKKRVTKSIALALVGVTIAIPMLNTASAMENSKETYSQKIERVSKSFEDFVYLEDNQYKLDISVSELSESSKSDFYIYNDYINLLNNIIVSNNIKNVTEDGFSLQISDEMAIESAKINNIEITDEMKSLAENMTKASGRSELKMPASRLSVESVTGLSRRSKLSRNQMTTVAMKMTENARSRKSRAFSHRSSATLCGEGKR